MRRVLLVLALAVRFGLELGVYGSVVLWGWGLRAPVPVRVAAAVVGVTVFAALWGRYAAPRASRPLAGRVRALFEGAWFGAGAAALAATGRVLLALAGIGVYVVQVAALRLVSGRGPGDVPSS